MEISPSDRSGRLCSFMFNTISGLRPGDKQVCLQPSWARSCRIPLSETFRRVPRIILGTPPGHPKRDLKQPLEITMATIRKRTGRWQALLAF